MTASAIYTGLVNHRRTRPVPHALRYRIFMMLVDLDESPTVAKSLRLFACGGRGLVSFREQDHGAGEAGGLRRWTETQLKAAGYAECGAIRLLCMPRVLGFAFKPFERVFLPCGGWKTPGHHL